MTTHDNEHTVRFFETDGPEADEPGAAEPENGMDHLRIKLGRLGKDDEPTREQLIATGELDPDEASRPGNRVSAGEGNGSVGESTGEGSGDEEATSTDLILPGEKQLSIRKQIEQRLMAGATRDELVAEGFNKKSVQTIASELKTKLQTRKPIGKAPATTSKGLPIFAKGSPPEAIIDAIEVPDVADGAGFAFEQGIKFGMSLVTIGIRMAQELSGIGIMQAKPLLDMAKSMREGEAVAAKNAAGEAAMEAAGMVRESMMPILMNIQRSGGGEGGDPVKGMMVRTMEPIMQKLMGGMLGRLVPGTAPLQITEGQGKVDGWTRRSE